MNFLQVESNGIVMQLNLMNNFLAFKIKLARLLDLEEIGLKFVGSSEFNVANQEEFEKAILGFEYGKFEVTGRKNNFNDPDKNNFENIDLAEICKKNFESSKTDSEKIYVFTNKSIKMDKLQKKSKVFKSLIICSEPDIGVFRTEKINVSSLLQPNNLL